MESLAKQANKYLCGHCNAELSKTLFYRHKSLYYDAKTKTWSSERLLPDSIVNVEDFTLSDDDSGEDECDESFSGPISDTHGDESMDWESEQDVDVEADEDNICDFIGAEEEEDNSELSEIWLDEIEDLECVTDHEPNQEQSKVSTITKLYLMFLFLWQVTFRVSDVGLGIMLKFFSMLLVLIGRLFELEALVTYAIGLPKSVEAGKKLLGTNQDKFSRWVCCPSCSAIYPLSECIEKLQNGKSISKTCPFVRFPRHPQRQHRALCGARLLKTVRTSSGSSALYPRMLFCYKSLIESLQELLLRPNFFQSCEQWRNRQYTSGTLSDVYDGQIWKDFLKFDGKPFLSLPFNFALSLNVDWFQPFKHTNYSVGAIYMAVQNLPRKERFLAENIILVGIIPGPNEPKLTMNTFLEPLVDELLKLWNGVIMKCALQPSVLVRAALICVTCDIPASRKVCGFAGHRAMKACTKCLKDFPTESFGTPPDFSGFDRENWPLRTNSSHREHAIEYRACLTQTQQNDMLRKHGCRYSLLLRLPYFDPVRMCVIDPMHNLLLGSARHVLSVWKELGILTDTKLVNIQDKVNSFVTTDDTGRIPSKIASGFSGFTAEQWRNWVITFSLFSLKEHLQYQHFQCWHLFVRACAIFCRRSVKVSDIAVADELIIEFCTKFQQLYGKSKCNINLHLHTHLSSCILDHGPVYSFWLFSFERLNGILGSFHTNCRDVSLQLMRKFLHVNNYGFHFWPEEHKDTFATLLSGCQYSKGSLTSYSLGMTVKNVPYKPVPPLKEYALSSHMKCGLINALSYFDPVEGNVEILSLYQACKAIQCGEYTLGSKDSRHRTASIVMVRTLQSDDVKPAEVKYYFRFHAKVSNGSNTETKSYWFAAVTLFQSHDCKVWFGSPTEVWSQVASLQTLYLPISYIKCRTAYVSTVVNFGRFIGEQDVLVVVPLINDVI